MPAVVVQRLTQAESAGQAAQRDPQTPGAHEIQPIGFLGRREATIAPTVKKDAAITAALKAAPNSGNESPADTPRKVVTKAVAPKRAENTQIDQAS
jgi:hypothetical protein